MKKLDDKILDVLKSARYGYTKSELLKALGMGKKRKTELVRTLEKMQKRQEVTMLKGRYCLASKFHVSMAEIVKVTGTFGFARPLSVEEEKDIFIPGRYLQGALPGDFVEVNVAQKVTKELPEGEIVEITQPSKISFSGTVVVDEHNHYAVLPDRYLKFPIRIAKGKLSGAKPADKVLAQIWRRGEDYSQHRVEILESFGMSGTATVCSQAILAENGIYNTFPEEVLEQAKAITVGSGISQEEIALRQDLREEIIFTIDGADTKDIDDAISLSKKKNGWLLGVHIADVSHYVTTNSPLDQEAYARGTSVYYADQVIPMLPKELSNGICSLNPREDRLAFSALMELDEKGTLKKFKFAKTIIRSRIKGVYHEINQILEHTASQELQEKYAEVTPVLEQMSALAQLRSAQRSKRGSIELSSPESKIIIGEDGKIKEVVPKISGVSEHMIEEFMLTANEAAAMYAQEKEVPFLYRVHPSPETDRLENLFKMLDVMGISYPPRGKSSVEFQLNRILESVQNTPQEAVVNSMILRTMAKAKYSSQNIGHFGLALQDYAHFTSPIRRYPDLAIHRILSALLGGMSSEQVSNRFGQWVDPTALQCSNREKSAMTAERDCVSCYLAEYMSSFVGEDFQGIISGVSAFGVFVRLENTAEGLISTRHFPPGRWEFDGLLSFQNTTGEGKIMLGDGVCVRVLGTDVATGQVDFVFS